MANELSRRNLFKVGLVGLVGLLGLVLPPLVTSSRPITVSRSSKPKIHDVSILGFDNGVDGQIATIIFSDGVYWHSGDKILLEPGQPYQFRYYDRQWHLLS